MATQNDLKSKLKKWVKDKDRRLEKWANVNPRRFIAASLGLGTLLSVPVLGGILYFTNRLEHLSEGNVKVDNKIYHVDYSNAPYSPHTVENRVGPDGREYPVKITTLRPSAVCRHTIFTTVRRLVDNDLDGKVDDVYTSTFGFKSHRPTNEDQALFDLVVGEYNKMRFSKSGEGGLK